MKVFKKVIMLVAVLACVVAVVGCAGRGTLSDEVDDNGTYTITASDAAKDAAVGSLGGGVTIKEGQVLSVNPNVEKGSLQVKISNAAGEIVLDEKASGNASSLHDLEPGEYSISVICNEDGTTGKLVVGPTGA